VVGNPDKIGNARGDRVNQRVLITVASALRLMILFRVPVFVIGDSGVYTKTAMTFTSWGSFAPLDGFYPPAYPVFVAVIQMVLGPDFLGVAAVQHALGIVTVLATYGVARMALPPTWAMVPAFAMAVNGYILILEHGIYTEALFIPLVTVGAWLTLHLVRTGGLGTSIATGVVIAFASLTRLVLQPFLGVVMLLAIASGGWPVRRVAVFRAIAVGASFVVVVTPIFHSFWTFEPALMANQLNHFIKNCAVVGGLLYIWAHGAGGISMDARAVPEFEESGDS
jgi:putative oxidoreductase